MQTLTLDQQAALRGLLTTGLVQVLMDGCATRFDMEDPDTNALLQNIASECGAAASDNFVNVVTSELEASVKPIAVLP